MTQKKEINVNKRAHPPDTQTEGEEKKQRGSLTTFTSKNKLMREL